MNTIKRLLLLCSILAIFLLLANVARPASAGVQPQVYYQTPTPYADGRIIYIVQAGDTCLGIALKTNVSLDQFRALNNIKTEECMLREGQEVLLGVVEQAQPTAAPASGPTLTPTSMLPSPTPFLGNGDICAKMFGDINGNALAEESEATIPGGVISITDRSGKVSQTANTNTSGEPVCFTKLPEGEYNISAAIPDGYNPTTDVNYALTLKAGDVSQVNFGVQIGSKATDQGPGNDPKQPGQRSPLLAIVGGVMLLGGLGMGVYFLRIRRG